MMLSDVCLTTSVAYIVNIQCAHSYWKQARWAPQARRKACMGWSWAAARGVVAGAYPGGRPPTACFIIIF